MANEVFRERHEPSGSGKDSHPGSVRPTSCSHGWDPQGANRVSSHALPASIKAHQHMAEIDGVLSGDSEARFEGVMAAICLADNTGSEKHGEVLGSAGGRGAKALRDLTNRQSLALGKLAEDIPSVLARDGGENLGNRKPRRLRTGCGVRGI